LPVAVPALDQIAARLLSRLCFMHHAEAVIGMDCLSRSAARQIACCIPLPVLALAADLMDFHAAMTLMQRAEGRAGLYCLELLRIANQHHLCASLRRMRQHALQLPRADHT